MNNDIILSTSNTFFQYKRSIYEDYVVKTNVYKEYFIYGEGKRVETSEIINEESIFQNFIDYKLFFQNGFIVFTILQFEHRIDEKDEYGNIITIDDYFKKIKKDFFGNSEFPLSEIYNSLTSELIDFFKKYGIPDSMRKNKASGVSLNSVILKLNDLFIFCDNLDDLENKYSLIEIPTAKIGLTKNINNEFRIISYFDCPFEYTKFNLLNRQVVGKRKIIQCKHCQSIIIPKRKDQIFCSGSCRAMYSKEQKKLVNK